MVSINCVIVYHTCYGGEGYMYFCWHLLLGSLWAEIFVLLRWLLFQGSVISYLGISTAKRILSQTFRTQEADRTVAREVWSRAPVVYYPFPFANGSAARRLADGTFFHWPLNWLWYDTSGKSAPPKTRCRLFHCASCICWANVQIGGEISPQKRGNKALVNTRGPRNFGGGDQHRL